MTELTVGTSYYGPTETNGSRIRVEYLNRSVKKIFVPYDHSWANPHSGALYGLHPGAKVEFIGEMGAVSLYRVTTNEEE